MKTINSSYSGAYYQLPGSAVATQARQNSAAPSGVAGAQNPASSAGAAFLLDLSPAARQFLNNLPAEPTPVSSGEFFLSLEQDRLIDQILEKYKDEPQDQETFNMIQDDLRAANIAPEQLSALDRVSSFNVTQVFLSNLSGNGADLAGLGKVTEEKEKAKSDRYIEMIVGRWKQIATQQVTPAAAA